MTWVSTGWDGTPTRTPENRSPYENSGPVPQSQAQLEVPHAFDSCWSFQRICTPRHLLFLWSRGRCAPPPYGDLRARGKQSFRNEFHIARKGVWLYACLIVGPKSKGEGDRM